MWKNPAYVNYYNSTYSTIIALLWQDTPLEKLDKKHFVKGSHGSVQNGAASTPQETNDRKEIALMEAKMEKLCDLLHEVRASSLSSLVIFFHLLDTTIIFFAIID